MMNAKTKAVRSLAEELRDNCAAECKRNPWKCDRCRAASALERMERTLDQLVILRSRIHDPREQDAMAQVIDAYAALSALDD